MSERDAADRGLVEGDVLEISTPRGRVEAKLRVSGIRPGVVFLPFHYGYWDADDGRDRAANELTATDWDPVSKQPLFKTAAAAVRKLADAEGPSAAPTTTASAPVGSSLRPTTGGVTAEAREQVGGQA
jgi:predicted molibdopterin-dependent oxidoreductase YjgC